MFFCKLKKRNWELNYKRMTECKREARRRVVGFGDKKSMLRREAPLTETQGSQENAFYHSRGELREAGEQKYI